MNVTKRSAIAWSILAICVAAVAYFVSIPVALLALACICGAPLFAIILGAAALGALGLPRGFDAEFDGMIEHILDVGLGDRVHVMSAIPLFIYSGNLLAEAGAADRLVRFANALLGWVPGGLAIIGIGACALFTVFTGASGVAIIALSGKLLPAFVRAGYPKGSTSGTGSLFPRQRFDVGELGKSFLLALPELCIPFGVICGLAIGLELPEVAALTVVYTVVLEIGVARLLVSLDIGWVHPLAPRALWTASRESLAIVGAVFIIVFASAALTDYMVTAEVPNKLVAWMRSPVALKIVLLLASAVIYRTVHKK
jgi:TRAP-type C4-dicarboxylate transport system permease large subunit